MHNKFKGTGVALVTPFLPDGQIDFLSLEKVISNCILNKVEYLVTLGTTGESATLSKQEKREVVDFTIDKISGKVPLIIGIGGNNTYEVAETIKTTDFSKIDGILSVSPYYNKPTQDGIYAHYKVLAEVSPVPVILYNVPARTASNISAETTLKLAQDFKNIVGIKEASGDFNQITKIVSNKPDNFLVISGDDAITLPLVACGADGVISVIANGMPKEFAELTRLALAGNFESARKLQFKLTPILDLLFKEGNPAGIKCVMEILRLCKNNVRLPLVAASENLKVALRNAISELTN